ncbi:MULTISPECIES: acyl carrier protein [Streptomyces]|uniref:Acyl carrier protein n=1 Tax=Streptomyces radiopugnans TaxID=403935 RepID=A0A1H9GBE4_9ACTN|nr:acyl carrier protein [Streptomyces radiopugnans]URN13449.1 acyl carrier protein [Streptomyces radiopugnans]SEQ47404.1 acyl carrier protein [Streptomyces radiopugnans]
MGKAYGVVADILVGKFQFTEGELSPGATLEEIDLDSLGRVEFALTLRESTGVPFGDDQITLDTTLGEIADAVEAAWGAGTAVAPR